jgi:predicted AlkP superfamily pyrophosphatase or phosphodiesterase
LEWSQESEAVEVKTLNRLVVAALCVMCAVAMLAQKSDARKKPLVVVISLDAFGAELLKDPLLPVPTLRSLMQNGAWATAMQPVNPTVTWPNHTSMVTGVAPAKHGLIANGQITGQRTGKEISVEFHADKNALVHVPTVYDRVHDAGMVTSEMDWVAVENAKSIDWSFFEQPKADMPLLKEMLADGSLKQWELDGFRKGDQPLRDDLYTRGAVYAIKHHHPNLVLLHLLSLDGNEHRYGFGTPAGNVTAAYLDDRVKEVIDAVREAGDMDRATFLIVSDHGQSSVHHSVDANAVLVQAGISPADATALDEGGVAYVYITKGAESRHAELMTKIRAAFAANPATDSVPTEEEIVAQGWPRPAANPTAFDVLAYAKEGWEFGGPAYSQHSATDVAVVPQTGAHGYPNTRPLMQAIFIASGAAVKKTGEIPAIPNVDVAATIAQILGVSQAGMDGKVPPGVLK